MKSINFTHPGGFPLTQDELDYLQQAYTECIYALTRMGGDGSTPTLISGMESSVPSPGAVTIADGWFFYNGELIKFTGDTVSPATGTVPLIVISPVATNLTYNDGSSFPAVLNKTATVVAAASVTDATHFPYSALQPFQTFFGNGGREANWNQIVVATDTADGNVEGTIYYKKNWLTNTLHIRASLNANAANNFSASPFALNYLMGTLPSGYIPNNAAYFTTYYFAANMFEDDLGVAWVKQLTSAISTSGQIYINFIKPESSVSAYSVIFNTIIPLD